MTATTHDDDAAPGGHEAEAHGHGAVAHDHPTDLTFVKVALALGAFTAIEVFTYFRSVHQMPDWLVMILLIFLMLVKFYLVVAFFMHLKYDNPIFSKLFAAGLFLATPVYLVMLYALGLYGEWGGDLSDGARNFIKGAIIVVPPAVAFVVIGLRRRSRAGA